MKRNTPVYGEMFMHLLLLYRLYGKKLIPWKTERFWKLLKADLSKGMRVLSGNQTLHTQFALSYKNSLLWTYNSLDILSSKMRFFKIKI